MSLAVETRTIGLYLLDCLQRHGVQHIFGVPGDYVLRFDKLIEQHAIAFVNATAENNAGYMADAYARLCGLGVACITYGVGIAIANAVSQAYVEGSPLVVISGAAGTDDFKKNSQLHHLINRSHSLGSDTTQLEIFKHITIDQAVLNDPKTAVAEINRVLDACLRFKKPVYIELPKNFVDALIPEESGFNTPLQFPCNQDALQRAIGEIEAILLQCKRPVIWAGHEIQRFGLASLLLHFAEKFQIPIVSSFLGKTVVSETHPLFFGVYQGRLSRPEVYEYVEECDSLFTLGVILDEVGTGIFTAKTDCEKSVYADSNRVRINNQDVEDVHFSDFVKALVRVNVEKAFDLDKTSFLQRKSVPFYSKPQARTTTERLFECLQSHLGPEHLIVSDFGDCLFGCTDLVLEQDSFLSSAYFGSLGFGTPGAVGAAIAVPDRRVIGVVGDGAFQMTAMELSTAVRYHLDPVIIVLNNHGYATERPLLEGSYNDVQEWNYSEIPKVLNGGIGIKVNTEAELEEALTRALLKRGTFYLIEVDVDKLDFSPALRRFSQLVLKKKAT